MTAFPSRNLLAWFKRNQRKLPWRIKRTPYATWVSEIMLQQTQVKQVEPYFNRFMNLFPEIKTLAEAPLQKVLKAWEGLGYYSRARNLHQAAQVLNQEFQGKIPDRMEKLIKLPGIGRSTAGAILSLSFNQTWPVLDGNIKRVVSRFIGLEGDPGETETVKTLWETAGRIIPPGKAALFNEALMELGALVCSPKKPACPECPIKSACEGYKSGDPERFPLKRPTKKTPHYDVAAAVIRNKGKILITQRPERGLLGGLWEFPGGKKEPGETLEECLKREIQEELNIEIQIGEKFFEVRHAYTHFRITLHCFFCKKIKGRLTPLEVKAFQWITYEELDHFPFPRADQKVIEYLKESRGQGRGVEVNTPAVPRREPVL
jgi:A/G-specific adenine glycosylase